MLSRVEITLKDGRKLVRDSDARYRGGPEFPLSDEELQAKFTDCTADFLNSETRQKVFETVLNFEKLDDVQSFIALLNPESR